MEVMHVDVRCKGLNIFFFRPQGDIAELSMHRDPNKAQHQECKAGNLQVVSVWSSWSESESGISKFSLTVIAKKSIELVLILAPLTAHV